MDADRLLYHYCSATTAASILTRKSIWLSSLTLSNDSLEGRLVRETLVRLSNKDGLNATYRERLEESLSFAERTFEGLGFCLSEEGDLLSQWRGYADDARGVAIGFSQQYLAKLAEASRGKDQPGFSLYQVEYDKQRQESALEPTYRELRRLIDAGAFRRRGSWSLLDLRTPEQVAEDDKMTQGLFNSLLIKLVELFPKLYELKSEGFREEREWRLVAMLVGSVTESCSFRGVSNRIVPYREYGLLELGLPPIREIVIGPKHATPVHVLRLMLQQSGFADVQIRSSAVSYR